MTQTQIKHPTTVRRSDASGPTALPPAAHFIDGVFASGNDNDGIDIVNPVTEERITTVPRGTTEDVDAAVTAAKAAQPAWGAKTPQDRAELLHQIADRILEHSDVLTQLEMLNTGKPYMVADDDITMTADTFRFMAGAGRALTSMAAGDYVEGHTSLILREPLGVVSVITPWNYPLMMAAWKLAPALAAGNSVVIKPSEQTPLTTLKLAELIQDILPPGLLNIVTGYGDPVGTRMAGHPEVDLVALTGSIGSGSAVASAAAPSRKRVHLELGGKAPVLIFPDADLEAAAQTIRTAGFWNSGQECGSACRVLVHDSVAADFESLLVAQVESLIVGEPDAGKDVEMGPLVSREHFERVDAHLRRAAGDGIRVAIGGGPLPGRGFFIAPTILAGVPEDAEATRVEMFGPIVTIETFSTDEEAVRRANETEYGLASSVWTQDAKKSMEIPRKLDFGTVWVNSHLVLANEVPWGGFKGSGYGRDLSLYALDDFSRTKHVMVNHGA